jgi:hypothetical protein
MDPEPGRQRTAAPVARKRKSSTIVDHNRALLLLFWSRSSQRKCVHRVYVLPSRWPVSRSLRVHVSFIPRDTMLVRARIFQARQVVIPCGARFVHVEDAIPRGSTMLLLVVCIYVSSNDKLAILPATLLTHSQPFFATILPKEPSGRSRRHSKEYRRSATRKHSVAHFVDNQTGPACIAPSVQVQFGHWHPRSWR